MIRKQRNLTLAELSRLPHRVAKAGREWRMACPLHKGSNPTSFSVDPATGLFHCFSCGASGRLLDYSRLLATGVGPFYGCENRVDKPKLKQSFGKLVSSDPGRAARLQRWFRAKQKLIARARSYLEWRGISLETARRTGLGYDQVYSFPATRVEKGKLTKVEMVKPAVLFPLYTPQGFVSYYARGIARERLHHLPPGPKGLFNFQGLKSATSNYPPILVEGCFDALAFIQSGYPNAVALVGTSLIQPLWFGGLEKVILAFDRDEAGQRAEEAVAKQLRKLGVKCFTLPKVNWGNAKDFSEFWQKRRSPQPLPWKGILGTLRFVPSAGGSQS